MCVSGALPCFGRHRLLVFNGLHVEINNRTSRSGRQGGRKESWADHPAANYSAEDAKVCTRCGRRSTSRYSSQLIDLAWILAPGERTRLRACFARQAAAKKITLSGASNRPLRYFALCRFYYARRRAIFRPRAIIIRDRAGLCARLPRIYLNWRPLRRASLITRENITGVKLTPASESREQRN